MDWGTQYPKPVSPAEPDPFSPLLNAHKQERQEYTWELTKEMEDQENPVQDRAEKELCILTTCSTGREQREHRRVKATDFHVSNSVTVTETEIQCFQAAPSHYPTTARLILPWVSFICCWTSQE